MLLTETSGNGMAVVVAYDSASLTSGCSCSTFRDISWKIRHSQNSSAEMTKKLSESTFAAPSFLFLPVIFYRPSHRKFLTLPMSPFRKNCRLLEMVELLRKTARLLVLRR